MAQTVRSWEMGQVCDMNGSVEKSAGLLGRGEESSATSQTGMEKWGRVRWGVAEF